MVNESKNEVRSASIRGVPPLAWGKSGETTFCGALAAALAPRVHQANPDYTTIMGVSSLAFRVRWVQGSASMRWSGVSPVGEFPEERDRVARALGLELHVEDVEAKDPKREAVIDAARKSIDAGMPVLAYVAPHMDMGVVYGYEGSENLLVQDYWIVDGYNRRKASEIGSFFIFPKRAGEPLPPRDAAVIALKAAVTNWERHDRPRMDESTLLYGGDAYDKWIADLSDAANDTADDQNKLLQASWWNFDCLNDARGAAAGYLHAIAPQFDGEAQAHLENAAKIYEGAAKLSGPVFGEKKIFLGPWSKKTIADWTPEVRGQEVEMLKSLRGMDEKAIGEIKIAIQ